MPGGAGGYLPPVVAQLVGDSGDFIAKLQAAKAMLLDFSRTDTTAKLGASLTPLQSSLTTAKMELLAFAKELYKAKLGADAAPLWSEVAAVRAALAAMSPVEIDVDLKVAGTMARLEALRGAFALASVGAMLPGAGGAGAGGGRGGGVLAGLLGGMFVGGNLQRMLWGRGGLPFVGNMGLPLAGFGTLGSFAGFGAERLLFTALGLAGSAGGAALGGGLLGLGTLGTMGVGMGSDLAVAKSTIADTKTLTTLYGNLARAQAVYGTGSRQAAIAQAQLNQRIAEMGGASQVGVAAEMKLAQAAMQFNSVWDKVTQGARASFVNNVALPALQMAQNYLPLIGDAAQRNFSIMGSALKPLFAFLSGPGTQVFQRLENIFAANLPTGVGIFVQSLELVIRTIDNIAQTQNLGGFLKRILDFVTRLNGPEFAAFSAKVATLIGMFHTWVSLFGAAGRVIFDVFSQSAGLGTSIVQSVTQMLNRLDAWLRSTQGQAQMKNVFEAHKDQILALIKAIPQLVEMFGRIYLALAPILTRTTIPLINIVVGFLNWINSLKGGLGTFMQWGVGLTILAAKFGLLHGPMQALSKALTSLIGDAVKFVGHWLAEMGKMVAGTILNFAKMAAGAALNVAKMVLANVVGAAQSAAAWVAANAVMVLSGVGMALLVIGALILLITHWKQVVAWLGQVVNWVRQAYTHHQLLFTIILILLGPIGILIRLVATVIDHWKQIVTWIGNVVRGFGDFIGKVQAATGGLSGLIGVISNVLGWLGNLAGKAQIVGNALNWLNPFAKHSPSLVESVIAGTALISAHYGAMADKIGTAATRAKGHLSSLAAVGPSGTLGVAIAGAGARGGGGTVQTITYSPTINLPAGAMSGNPQQQYQMWKRLLDEHTADLTKALKGGAYLPGQGLA